jgi:WD40 repeat protein
MWGHVDDKFDLFTVDLATGKTRHAMRGGTVLGISSDVHYLALIDYDEVQQLSFIEVLELDTGTAVFRRKIEGGMRPKHAAFSPDGRTFACTPSDEIIEFYDTRSWKRLGPPRKHWAYVHNMDFSLDGKSLAASYNDSVVLVWEVLRLE